ncbi:MAG TPA: dihydrofolate reductase family protein [Candidatus Saccharimonadales bacterium]|nr:dihydrofolate reductase family protein [Candidatus Saccharimonadales bacterium]
MTQVRSHMSMSVDGFVAGPDASQDNPLGTNGLKLHDWIFNNPDKAGRAHPDTLKKETGAAIIGYNMYFEAIPHWGGTGPLGDDIPCFVLTEANKVPENAPAAFTFVTDGIENALEQAKAAAGDKDVWIGGGAATIQQYIKAGLLDEFELHIVPILLGRGTPMFGELGKFIELEKAEVRDEPDVTHFLFRF